MGTFERIRLLFMGFTSLADIVTDILFIQSLFDDGETTWGSVALAIFGINYVVGILQAVFDSERTFLSIISGIFLLEKSMLAFSAFFTSPDSFEYKPRREQLRRISAIDVGSGALPQALITTTILLTGAQNVSDNVLTILSLAFSVLNSVYSLSNGDSKSNYIEIFYWLFEVSSRLALLAIFFTAIDRWPAVFVLFLTFFTRAMFIKYVTAPSRQSKVKAVDDDDEPEIFWRLDALVSSIVCDGFMSIIGEEYVLPFWSRIASLQILGFVQGIVLGFTVGFIDITTNQELLFDDMRPVLGVIAALYVAKYIIMWIQYCQSPSEDEISASKAKSGAKGMEAVEVQLGRQHSWDT